MRRISLPVDRNFEEDDLSTCSDDQGSSIQSFQSSQTLLLNHSFDSVEKKLGKLEYMLDDFRASQNSNWKVEQEWLKHRDEIFGAASAGQGYQGAQPLTRKDRRFLARLAKPKRKQDKKTTDGIAKTYHDDLVHQAKELPG